MFWFVFFLLPVSFDAHIGYKHSVNIKEVQRYLLTAKTHVELRLFSSDLRHICMWK
uniref:Uncharacterized protein n=1 Tax=Anguilla anguilla TaxID=7936 RepID=A0A0E9WFX6_ANGAN